MAFSFFGRNEHFCMSQKVIFFFYFFLSSTFSRLCHRCPTPLPFFLCRNLPLSALLCSDTFPASLLAWAHLQLSPCPCLILPTGLLTSQSNPLRWPQLSSDPNPHSIRSSFSFTPEPSCRQPPLALPRNKCRVRPSVPRWVSAARRLEPPSVSAAEHCCSAPPISLLPRLLESVLSTAVGAIPAPNPASQRCLLSLQDALPVASRAPLDVPLARVSL